MTGGGVLSSRPDKLHLAIVDDEVLVRVALGRLCSAIGMRVSAYASGRALIDGLDESASAPDCLLLDAHMPDMSGLEILQQLVRRAVRFPTIVYSADDEPEAIDRYVEAGAVAYLRKPVLADVLVDAITRAVDGSSAV
jgi:FixJ family two-component response regulator